MSEQWCIEKLEKLKVKEIRLNTLAEIKRHLNESNNLETKVTNRLLSSSELYDCLEEENGDNVGINIPQQGNNGGRPLDLVSDILSICMANLSLKQSDLPRLLQRSLRHKKPHIRSLALNTILKELKSETSNATGSGMNGNNISKNSSHVVLSDELLLHILKALQEPDIVVGNPAVHILLLALESRLQESWVKDALLEALRQNEIIKCRVYELAVGLSKYSPETLHNVEFVLDHALSQLDNDDDILIQVNVLEILVSLVEQNHGLLYLEKRQVFAVLSKRVENVEENPIDNLLIPGIMKFFGRIASFHPEITILGYPRMIKRLFDCLDNRDVNILPTAFDTLVNLSSTKHGIILLKENYRNSLEKFFTEFPGLLKNLSTELKKRALDCLTLIFTKEADQEISSVLNEWFNYMNNSSSNMQFLFDYCSNPFPDLKIACLNVIRSVCLHHWGIEALKNTAGLLEFLLDRKVEFDKEAKYAKYCVIQLLADSDLFDSVTNHNLRTYLNEGPYFVQSIVDIATEGSGGGGGGGGNGAN